MQTSTQQFAGNMVGGLSQILLATAVIEVLNHFGERFTTRVLLDSGSQINLNTRETCNALRLRPKFKGQILIKGINGNTTIAKEYTDDTIKSRFNSFKTTLSFLVTSKITDNLPLVSINMSEMHIPKNLNLADPYFHRSSKIDMLIGAEIYYDLLCIGEIKPSNYGPTLQKTKLGWIVSGRTNSLKYNTTASCHFTTNEQLDNQLTKFWDIEEITHKQLFSPEEAQCENHFKNNFFRDVMGRFCVKLPFKSNISQLGESHNNALRCF